MTDVGNEAALVHRHGWRLALHAQPTAILWQGSQAAVALGDGTVRWLGDDRQATAVTVHGGAILAACRHPDGVSVVTGGDDGGVHRVTPDGEAQTLGQFERKWVEHLVASPDSGLIVAGVGRDAVVWARGASEPSHSYSVGSTVGGLALGGKGKRLAITHYNGATLVYPSMAGSGRVALNWVGSHRGCTLSADAVYLITALQETGLHGWRLPEMRDMRMSGYAAKTRSFSWSRRCKWLATSGDPSAILWPFEGKTGPIGKAPLLLAQREDVIVTRVAFHPREDLLAVGYSDGVVVLARLADDQTLRVEEDGASICALAWNDAGTRLGWGDEDGRVGILDMDARA